MQLQKIIVITFLLIFGLVNSASAELAEDFTFKDIKGQSHKLSDYRGKWVLANYWGTYCSPCLEEIPDLIKFTNKHKKEVAILGFDAGGSDLPDLITFSKRYKINYLVAPVQESTINAFGILMVIPTTYIIDPNGELVDKVLGIVDLESIEDLMATHENTGTKAPSQKGGNNIPAPAPPKEPEENDDDEEDDFLNL
ncbi:MAG: TlpA family protein disulfide reductase [Thiotrichaceae bacterium]|nr:TlpA family protein disulfide reductase [Thiotrichaceae bacterium]